MIVSLREKIHWPSRSPDLNPCDFSMWEIQCQSLLVFESIKGGHSRRN